MATDTRTSEEEVLEAFHTFYQMWAARQHQDDVEKLLIHCDAGVTVIGTGAHEILVGIDAFRQLIIDDLAEVPGTLEVTFPWSRAKIFDNVGVVEAEMELKVPIDGSLQSIGLLRLTAVFLKQDDRLVMEHVHMSFPSSDQTTDEVWPTEALKARNQELERQVAERTNALQQALLELKATQAQLIHQEKMASLGQLTAGIAHEIKNPLNFVNNFADLNQELAQELNEELARLEAHLPDGVVDDFKEALSYMQVNAAKIREQGQRADGIVQSMMQHASGGSGEREATDVNALVEEYVGLAYHGKRAQTPDFNAELRQDLAAEVGSILMVPQNIGRVLLNLLGNAFDAVYEHALTVNGAYAPTVTVSTRQVEGQVEIRVSDNGPGIPAEIKEKIFEPFFTTKPTGSGTGLGLSLSYDIVTQGHGGTLAVESEDGKGATFVVTLPVTHQGAIRAPDYDRQRHYPIKS